MRNINIEQVLAIDFDQTIALTDNMIIIGDVRDSITAITELLNKGYIFILNTCRTDVYLNDAVTYLDKRGIKPHFVNENIPELINKYNNNSRKIFAGVYIDDRNVGVKEIIWKDIYFQITGKKLFKN